MTNSHKPRKHAASVHFDEDLWDRVTQLAGPRARPVSQLLRKLVADAVDVRITGPPRQYPPSREEAGRLIGATPTPAAGH
jgi:hypothetical protein